MCLSVKYFCYQQCNDDLSKSAVTTMGFAIEDKHFIKW